MDDIIVRVARAVACPTRLRILSRLVQNGETMPTGLAEHLGMPNNTVSAHLRRLSSAGLILRRRSGLRCYCAAQSPYSDNALSGKITSCLRKILTQPAKTMNGIKNCAVLKLCNFDGDGRHRHNTKNRLHEIIFDAATAFTNHRRLQILRRLTQGVAAAEGFTEQLRMSDRALRRHSAKLIRRGYVAVCRVDGGLGYRLAPKAKTPVHSKLFKIIRAEWHKT